MRVTAYRSERLGKVKKSPENVRKLRKSQGMCKSGKVSGWFGMLCVKNVLIACLAAC